MSGKFGAVEKKHHDGFKFSSAAFPGVAAAAAALSGCQFEELMVSGSQAN